MCSWAAEHELTRVIVHCSAKRQAEVPLMMTVGGVPLALPPIKSPVAQELRRWDG